MARKIPKIFKNFYVVSLLVFIVWILFLDGNDLITQYDRRQRLEELEQEKVYFEQEIKKVEREQEALSSDSQAIERFAREKFFLKKPKEDVYVIEEQESEIEE